ncbi:hypothetical protein D3C80_2210030 [compost metagenome]
MLCWKIKSKIYGLGPKMVLTDIFLSRMLLSGFPTIRKIPTVSAIRLFFPYFPIAKGRSGSVLIWA